MTKDSDQKAAEKLFDRLKNIRRSTYLLRGSRSGKRKNRKDSGARKLEQDQPMTEKNSSANTKEGKKQKLRWSS